MSKLKRKKPTPRQIHLARHVPHKLVQLFSTYSESEAYIRALLNQYELIVDDSIGALDPYVDHEYARQLCGRILDAQRALQRTTKALGNYVRGTGFSTDPRLSQILREEQEVKWPRRRFLYTEKNPGRFQQPRPSHKKVCFAEEVEPPAKPGLCGKLFKDVTDKVVNLVAGKTSVALPQLLLTWYIPVNSPSQRQLSNNKSQGKRLREEDHYRSSQPVKFLKIWHETVIPEAYCFEDAGEGLDRPMTQEEIQSRTESDQSAETWESCEPQRKLAYAPEAAIESNDRCTDIVPYRRKPISTVIVTRSCSRPKRSIITQTDKNVCISRNHKLQAQAMAKFVLPDRTGLLKDRIASE